MNRYWQIAAAFFCLPLLAVTQSAKSEALRVESNFVAPCCWGESLAVHRSPLAEKLREEVGERIARGETEQSITKDLVARYGERILSEPRGGKRTLLAIVPAVASLLGAFVLIAYVRRPAPTTTSAPQQYQEQAAIHLNRVMET